MQYKIILIIPLLFISPLVLAKQTDEAKNLVNQIEASTDEQEASLLINNVEEIKQSKNFQKQLGEASELANKVEKVKTKEPYSQYKNWLKDNRQELFAKQTKQIPTIDYNIDKANKDAITELLQNYRFKAEDIKKNSVNYYPLMIFVSSSIPKSALKDLMIQARKSGAVLVFRGLIGSLRSTAEFLQNISKEEVAAIIDPRLFTTFQINQVPTFVVIANIQEVDGELITPKHDRIAGNITLEYALNHIIEGDGSAKEVALKHLNQLHQKGDHEKN